MKWRVEVLARPGDDCTLDRNDRLQIEGCKLRVPKSPATSDPFILFDGQATAPTVTKALALVSELMEQAKVDLETDLDVYMVKQEGK